MANKALDYAAHEGAELFNPDRPYRDGEQRWAARGNWFIRFWGYVTQKISPGDIPAPGSNRGVLYWSSVDDELTFFDGTNHRKFLSFTALPYRILGTNGNSELTQYSSLSPWISSGSGINIIEVVPFPEDTDFTVLGINLKKPIASLTIADDEYTLTTYESVIVNTSGGDVNLNLPPVSSGVDVTIKKISQDNEVIIHPEGTSEIEGNSELRLQHMNSAVQLRVINGNWYII